ncbi:MAG: hypothetical protein JOZ39_13425 [Chloroflexi bacterium]|nr:hypothetical protein [Chloroflexota bacterium]
MAIDAPAPAAMSGARRLYLYVMAFAGLMTVLTALDRLAALALDLVPAFGGVILSVDDSRQRATFSLAALIVGLPVCAGHWLVASRAVAASPAERQTRSRRAFLAATCAVAAIVCLVAGRRVLEFLFTFPAPGQSASSVRTVAELAFRILLFGLTFAVALRLSMRDRRTRNPLDLDQLWDLAFYIVTGWSLVDLVVGSAMLLSEAIGELLKLTSSQIVVLASGQALHDVWGRSLSWLVAGALAWTAVTLYDRRRIGSRWRTVYLYTVLVVAVPVTLGWSVDLGFELLRLGLGFRPDGGWFDFLRTGLPSVTIGTALWLFHWRLLKAQSAGRESQMGVVFDAPRRPAIVLLSLLGLFIAAPAVVSLAWVGFDWALQSASTLSGGSWWRDRTSFSAAAALVGGGAWLSCWLMMQRAARLSPSVEGTAQARRNGLALVVIVGAVVALGFAVAALWLVLQALFGAPFTPSRESLLVKELLSLAVAGGLAGYHATVLRSSGGLRGSSKHRLVALVTPGSQEVLAQIRRLEGIEIQQVFDLTTAPPAESDLTTFLERLQLLASDHQAQRTVVILHPDGGSLYPIAG